MRNQLIEEISCILSNNGVVVAPTDTLYGLLANATSMTAVNKLFEIKKREHCKSIPVFVSSLFEAQCYFEFTPTAIRLARKFWPGSLTMILQSKGKLATNISDSAKVAVRIPDNLLIRSVIQRLGNPVTATSANISGQENIFNYEELVQRFSFVVDYIVQGNVKHNAKPSTIVDCSQSMIHLVRDGAISYSEILYFLKS